MVFEPHPDSVIDLPDRRVALKVHQCIWAHEHPPNSLPAILACYRAPVARAEIDIAMLADEDFLVAHDLDLSRCTDGSGHAEDLTRSAAARLRLRHDGRISAEPAALLSDVAQAIAAEPCPTRLELDLKDWRPWPWPRVEELCRLVESIKDRVVFGGAADWNLRRLLHVDPTVPVGFTIMGYLDWVPADEEPDPLPGVWGAYGYLDAHPLARERSGPTVDYLRDRLGGILRLVPGSRETHMRLGLVERMADDGLTDLASFVHDLDLVFDVWTLDAGTPNWRARLQRALDMGADVVTTNTPRELAAAARA